MAKKKVKRWRTVADKYVRHVWRCEEDCCEETAIVTPDWYQQNGTPMCALCDVDMVYVRTEVRQ
jgi:hypothetical protein